MGLNLFNGESAPGADSERLSGGKIHAGYQENGKPVGLEAWRFSTEDPDTADRVAELFGGEVIEVPKGEDGEIAFEVFSEADELPIVIEQGGIGVSLVLWNPSGGKTAETDGTYLIEDGVVTENESPLTIGKSLDDIIAMGFKPNLRLNFRIEGEEELGGFVLFSGAKTALGHFDQRESELAEFDGPVSSTIGLEFVQSKRGGYRKPRIGSMTPIDSTEAPAKVETSTKKPAAKKAPAKKAAAKKATRKRVSK